MRKLKLATAISVLILLLGSVVFSILYFTKIDSRAKVVTTIFPIYDMCREIMGSDDELLMLEDTGSDMHSYNPTASDIATISQAEVFIFVGGESDNWIGNVMRSIKSRNLRTLSLIDEIDKIEETDDNILSGDDHTHSETSDHIHSDDTTCDEGCENDSEIEYDEHIWLSLRNSIKMVRAIKSILSNSFPEKQKLFETNANLYIEKLQALESDYSNALSGAEKPIIVADRFPFRYLVSDYNLDYFAVFSGCSAETEASTETIANLISKINENDVNYVLVLETSDQSIANSALSDNGCKKGVGVLVINSCQSVHKRNLSQSHYIDIMRANLENLKKVVN